MKRVFLAAVVVASSAGCMVERDYAVDGDGVGFQSVAALKGSAGPITDFDAVFTPQQRADEPPSIFDMGAYEEPYVHITRLDEQVVASLIVNDPRGNVYVDVQIVHPDRMEVGEEYTVAVDSEYEDGYVDPTMSDDPAISVYACPDAPEDASGIAEEITVVKESDDGEGNERFSFTANAPNERQLLFTDGFLVTSPADRVDDDAYYGDYGY